VICGVTTQFFACNNGSSRDGGSRERATVKAPTETLPAKRPNGSGVALDLTDLSPDSSPKRSGELETVKNV